MNCGLKIKYWRAHIDYVRSKLSSLTRIQKERQDVPIPHRIRMTIYNSLVKTYLENLIEIGSSAAKMNLKDLQHRTRL